MTWPLIILLVLVACLLGVIVLCFWEDLAGWVRGLGHGVVTHLRRAADDDDPFDQAIALTRPAPDPTPLPHDFLLWSKEMESTP